MAGQELILLGLLKENPMHGYEIKTKIKEVLALFAGTDLKSIYYPLEALEKKGFLTKRMAKEGRRPQRFVYSLTPKGEERFRELLSKSFLNFKRPQFSLDLSLYFLHYIKPLVARRRLRGRLVILKKVSGELSQLINSLKKQKSPALLRICEHNLRMLEAESGFLARLIKDL